MWGRYRWYQSRAPTGSVGLTCEDVCARNIHTHHYPTICYWINQIHGCSSYPTITLPLVQPLPIYIYIYLYIIFLPNHLSLDQLNPLLLLLPLLQPLPIHMQVMASLKLWVEQVIILNYRLDNILIVTKAMRSLFQLLVLPRIYACIVPQAQLQGAAHSLLICAINLDSPMIYLWLLQSNELPDRQLFPNFKNLDKLC